MITVRVLLFGHLKDVLPRGETTLALSDGATAQGAADALALRDARLAGLFAKARVAVGGVFADADTKLAGGDEIAFLPPMSGG